MKQIPVLPLFVLQFFAAVIDAEHEEEENGEHDFDSPSPPHRER